MNNLLGPGSLIGGGMYDPRNDQYMDERLAYQRRMAQLQNQGFAAALGLGLEQERRPVQPPKQEPDNTLLLLTGDDE
jgi:hypothetical protein